MKASETCFLEEVVIIDGRFLLRLQFHQEFKVPG